VLEVGDIYRFELLNASDAVVGGGWIIAPGAAAALRSASLLLGGASHVRLVPCTDRHIDGSAA
jgi:hypothetical protein